MHAHTRHMALHGGKSTATLTRLALSPWPQYCSYVCAHAHTHTHTHTHTVDRAGAGDVSAALLPPARSRCCPPPPAHVHVCLYTHACMHAYTRRHPSSHAAITHSITSGVRPLSQTAAASAPKSSKHSHDSRHPSMACVIHVCGVSVAVSLSVLTRLCVYILCMVQCVCVYMYRNILIHKHMHVCIDMTLTYRNS